MTGDVVKVAEGIYLGRGTDNNWAILVEDGEVTLIDAGFPGDADAVEASLRAVGRRPEDVRAILLTHAHLDHVGAVGPFHRRYGTPAYASGAEVGHARREFEEGVTRSAIMRNVWRPGVVPWLSRIARVGALRDVANAHVTVFPQAGPLDLPGRPVPVATPGHTTGHTSFLLPGPGVVVSGDALVTGHPVSRRRGPQSTPAMYNHGDPSPGLAVLGELAADTVLPGHGDPWRGDLRQAAARAAR